MFRRVLKGCRWAGICVLGAICIYFAAAVLGAFIPRGTVSPQAGKREHVVYLVAGPIHFDFVLPANPKTSSTLAFLNTAAPDLLQPDHSHYVIGWGSRAFYTTAGQYSDVRPGAVWQAATGDDSVMHIAPLYGFNPTPKTIALSLTDAQLDKLLRFFKASFERDNQDQPIRIANAGFGKGDAFFASPFRFNIFNTCNIWVADALEAANIKVGIWTPTPFALRWSL